MEEDNAARDLAAKDSELQDLRAKLSRAEAERDAAKASATPAAPAAAAKESENATDEGFADLAELEKTLASERQSLEEALAAGRAEAHAAAPLRRLADLTELVAAKMRRKAATAT